MIGQSITRIIPSELQDEESDILDKLYQGQPITHFETERLAKDGRPIPISLTISPIRDDSGVIIGASKIARDISERKQAEEALRENEQQFRVLIQNLKSAVALINESGEFAIVNQAFLRIFELNDDSSILNVNEHDWSKWKVFDEEGLLLDVDEHPVRKAALTGTPVRDKLVAVKAPESPELKWLLVSVEPTVDAQGQIHRLICTYHDITSRKQSEEQIQRHVEELRTLNNDLSRFNEAAVGRELRMIELKREINEHCIMAGLAQRYDLDFFEDLP
jgi:PAS domain-containing protein